MKTRNAPVIHVGNNIDKQSTAARLRILGPALREAIVMGREVVAVEIVRAIAKEGDAGLTTIQNCHFERA